MSPKLRFVLFDLDGTLVDSSVMHARAFEVALAAHRPALLARFEYGAVRGLQTRDAFRALGELDESVLRTLVHAKRAAFSALAADDEAREFPGATALLADGCAAGCGVFVVTSASRSSALRTLRRTGLALHVHGVIAAEDVTHGKPSPEPYLAAVKRFALRVHEGLAVEDAPAGLVSARGAGLDVIRVHGRFDFRDRGGWYPDLRRLGTALARVNWRRPLGDSRTGSPR